MYRQRSVYRLLFEKKVYLEEKIMRLYHKSAQSSWACRKNLFEQNAFKKRFDKLNVTNQDEIRLMV
ncbi:DUF3884 family protein [Pedobacter sp. GSP4]|uniref:DUF3884 family protein n=1 Tax=Pedobacter sp. GSP4 TaxID=3453716 RepID=UPI003EEA2B8B